MQDRNRSFYASIPPVTLHLLIINVLMWLATVAFQRAGMIDLNQWLGLHFWKASNFKIYQFFTYMFMHGGLDHLFCNMFSLWMLGALLERVLGTKRYLLYYIVCGLGAGLAQELVWQFSWQNILASGVTGPAATSVKDIIEAINSGHAAFTMDDFYNSLVTIGASGAVFGILLAFGMLFPNMPLYIFFIPIPVKAKWFVLGYGILELFYGVTGTMSSVAHFAHLGGLVTGIILILYWKHNGTLSNRYGFYRPV